MTSTQNNQWIVYLNDHQAVSTAPRYHINKILSVNAITLNTIKYKIVQKRDLSAPSNSVRIIKIKTEIKKFIQSGFSERIRDSLKMCARGWLLFQWKLYHP